MSQEGSTLDQRLVEAAWHLSQSNHPVSAAAVREAHDELAARTVYAERRRQAIIRLLTHLDELWGDHVVNGRLTLIVEADAIEEAQDAALAKNPMPERAVESDGHSADAKGAVVASPPSGSSNEVLTGRRHPCISR